MSVGTAEYLTGHGVKFEGEQHPYIPGERAVTLRELVDEGGWVVRVRWIGGDYIPGRGRCYDLSYVQGVLPDDTRVDVRGGYASLVPRHKLKAEMIEWAKEQGVFAKGCGLLDDGTYSILG